MRKLLIAAAAIALAAPAAAQAQSYEAPVDEDIAAALPDRGDMAQMAHVMDRLVGAVLDIPIGGIVAAVDPQERGYYRRGDTLRDMAIRNDPYAEERLRQSIHGTTAGMGAMVEAMAAMTPVLRSTIEQVQRNVDEALRGVGRPD